MCGALNEHPRYLESAYSRVVRLTTTIILPPRVGSRPARTEVQPVEVKRNFMKAMHLEQCTLPEMGCALRAHRRLPSFDGGSAHLSK
jgi:hypothetical protein